MNGLWLPGETIDGWSATQHSTFEECLEKRQHAQDWYDDLLTKEIDTYPKRFTCLSSEEYALWLSLIQDFD